MRITKYMHAAVRLERDGRALLIDPGLWTEPEALANVDAILVTHEHNDHLEPRVVEGVAAPIYAPEGADIAVPFTPVTSGEEFEVAGFRVRPVGDRHAYIYGEQPDCPNLGYVVDDLVYVPGDALHVPDGPIEVAFVPIHGSWMKVGEAIDFVRAIAPAHAYPIHDGQLHDERGGGANYWLAEECGTDWRRLAPGESVTTG